MDHFLRKPFTLDRSMRIIFVLIIGIALIVAVSTIWEVLLPFLLAGIFAYAMMPLVRFLQYKVGIKFRWLAVLLVFAIITTLISLGVIYIAPAIEREVEKTLEALSAYKGGQSLLEMLIPEWLMPMLRQNLNFEEISTHLSPESIMEASKAIWGQVNGIVSGTLSVFSWGVVFAMGIVYFIFIMLDFEGLVRGLVRLFPRSIQQPMVATLKEIDFYMNSYFRGQALIALSVATLLSIGFNLIGLPMATAMGIFIGLLNFIPYMQALGVIPLAMMSVLMAAQTNQGVAFCLLLSFGVLMIVQVLQDTLIVPRIMGQSMGMRPSLILLSLAVWGYLLGFFGMLVALPLTMSIYSIYMRYVLQDEEYIQIIDKKLSAREQSAQSKSSKSSAK